MSGTSYAVLGLVAVWGPCTPYDLKQAIDATVENFWPVPHTTFYVTPARLAKAGLLAVDQEEHGRRRKLYSITKKGQAALEAWVAQPVISPPQIRDELSLKVFLGADPEPITRQRVTWHRDKLAELESYLERVRTGEGTKGMENSLIAGTAYHQAMIDMLERLLAT